MLRAWYTELKQFLQSCGFQKAHSDNSLFILSEGSLLLVVMVYVDDIVVTGSSPSRIQQIITMLGDHVSIKDLVPLHFFLGIEAIPSGDRLLLSQSSFIAELLDRVNMLNAYTHVNH